MRLVLVHINKYLTLYQTYGLAGVCSEDREGRALGTYLEEV